MAKKRLRKIIVPEKMVTYICTRCQEKLIVHLTARPVCAGAKPTYAVVPSRRDCVDSYCVGRMHVDSVEMTTPNG